MSLSIKAISFMSLLIGIIVISLILYFVPHVKYMPQGIFLPDKENMKYPPAQYVSFMDTYPLFYHRMGIISIERHAEGSSIQAKNQVLEVAKRLAAKHGSNAIVVEAFGRSDPKGDEAGLAAYYFLGVAIYGF